MYLESLDQDHIVLKETVILALLDEMHEWRMLLGKMSEYKNFKTLECLKRKQHIGYSASGKSFGRA